MKHQPRSFLAKASQSIKPTLLAAFGLLVYPTIGAALCPLPQPDPSEVVWLPHKTYCPGIQPPMSPPASWLLYENYPDEDIPDCVELQWELTETHQEPDGECDLVPGEFQTSINFYYPIFCNGNGSPNYWASSFEETYYVDEYTRYCPGYPPQVLGPSYFGNKYFVQVLIEEGEVSSEKNRGTPSCGLTAGNPINVATGNKYHFAEDAVLPDGMSVTRHYNSQDGSAGAFGIGWRGTYSRRIKTPSSFNNQNATLTIARDDGKENYWRIESGVVIPPPDATARLDVNYAAGEVVGYTYVTSDNSLETYDAEGKLISVQYESGDYLSLAYTSSQLDTVSTRSGRQLTYTYNPDGTIQEITSSGGGSWKYYYDGNLNLTQVEYPGGTTRTYHYENRNLSQALTGETDESGVRIRTWAYDAQGRAILSTFGSSLSTVNRYEITYNADGTASTIDPLQSPRDHSFEVQHGVAKFDSVSQVCSACGSSSEIITYDDHGNKDVVSDFNGNVTDYDYSVENLPTRITYGVNTPDQYQVDYVWDTTLRKPISVTQGDSSTTYSYNSRGQVLTRIESDLISLSTRTWVNTYFEPPALSQLIGKVESSDGPRTDVSDIITYEYHTIDHPSGDYLIGDLKSVVNALGHRTDHLKYDADGRVLEIQDANNVLTVLTYHPRGWISSRTTDGKTTLFTYDNVGNLTRVTQPDGSYIDYAYDDAHRLEAIADNFNNWVEYTLDAAGNRTAEKTYDDVGVLRRQLSRVYDQLNRLETLIDGNLDETDYTYDNNGNRTSTVDANQNTTSFEYDGLNRLTKTIDAILGETLMGYDDRGNLTHVTDPLGNVTQYTYDGLDNQTELDSPDTGTTTYEYDDAGNRTAATDARGIRVEYSYDAINRLTDISHPDSSLNVSFTYDVGTNGKGRLTQMSDAAGTVDYSYDARGNLISETRTIAAEQYVTAYAYNDADRLTQIVYPSSMVVDYTLDAAGRITAVDKTVNSVTEPLASAIQYEPFGPVASFTYGNGLTYSASFDQDYELDQLQAGSGLDWIFGYDPVGNILTIDDQIDNGLDQTFTYDELYRLDTALGGYGSEDFDYDANGNRLRYQNAIVDDAYSYQPQSNRLATQNGWTFTRDAAGNRTEKLDGGGYGQLYTYADNNRLVQTSVRDAGGDTVVGDYVYDGRGQRTIKTSGGTTTHFIYGPAGELLGEYRDVATDLVEYVYLNAQPIAVYTKKYEVIQPPDIELVLDNGDPGTSSTGSWQSKSGSQDYGADYLYANLASNTTYRWTPSAPGIIYEVYAWWVDKNNQSDTVIYTIRYGNSETATLVKSHKTGGGQWQLLGSYYSLGIEDYVEVSSGSNKFVADAVKWVEHQDPIIVATETTHFIHTDQLGTPRQVSDDQQTVVWRWDSAPFGDTAPDEDLDGDLTTFTLNLRLPGQYTDAESGLIYNYFRTYDPQIGRYIESDPIGLRGGLNMYGYGSQNPILLFDRYGLAVWEATSWFQAAAAMGIGAGLIRAEFESECYLGTRYRINVTAVGPTAGVSLGAKQVPSLPVSHPVVPPRFADNSGSERPDPGAFNGPFLMIGANAKFGTVDAGAGDILLGRAISIGSGSFSVSIGFEVGVLGGIGTSTVTNIEREDCCDE